MLTKSLVVIILMHYITQLAMMLLKLVGIHVPVNHESCSCLNSPCYHHYHTIPAYMKTCLEGII